MRNIYFTETGLQNSSQDSLSSENIAIIELHEKLVLSPSVYPACVNWDKNDTLFPQDGELGQASECSKHRNCIKICLKFSPPSIV